MLLPASPRLIFINGSNLYHAIGFALRSLLFSGEGEGEVEGELELSSLYSTSSVTAPSGRLITCDLKVRILAVAAAVGSAVRCAAENERCLSMKL
jgi:hypothetical protein